ncbi:MAG: IreB family regulatory phosphoprotein [Eubacterium sp.]|nr:IreB family regulatory phosphoprotein [Eubacterium sp.]
MNYQIHRNSHSEASYIIADVYNALKEKGYDPVNQIVGYILSGDPTYITGHNNARNLISKLERDELLEEIVATYIKKTIGK